jgi:hypothetical protein
MASRAGEVPGGGQDTAAGGEQVAGVGEHLSVVVHVHDPGVRTDTAGGFVGVRGSRQSAAGIEELADSQVGDVGDGAGLEPACLHRQVRGVREDPQHPRRLVAVGGEIVFAARMLPQGTDGSKASWKTCPCRSRHTAGADAA